MKKRKRKRENERHRRQKNERLFDEAEQQLVPGGLADHSIQTKTRRSDDKNTVSQSNSRLEHDVKQVKDAGLQ